LSFNEPDRNFSATVYYPGHGIAQTVPLVVFAHGWGGSGTWYEFFAGALVPYGYVMASIDDHRGTDNNPERMAQEQAYLRTEVLNQAATNKSSPIYGMLNGKVAGSGHSNGGAATIITQSTGGPTLWNSMATLSAAFPDYITTLPKNITNPALIITGTKDCVCPAPSNAYPIYGNLTNSPCKYLINIVNATHCQFWDERGVIEDTGCNDILEHRCYQDRIPRHQQYGLVAKYILPWYDYVLKGKSDRLSLIDSMLKADTEDGVLIWEKDCNNY